MPKSFLITGCAGFIGFHLTKKLLESNQKVVGIDNINDYYDIKLKKDRLNILKKKKDGKFIFFKKDLLDKKILEKIFKKYKFNFVIHLAAQAGVRYSLINPRSYIDNNLIGFFNILNECKKRKVDHFIHASTSSVYGNTNKFPIKETFDTSSPLQLYAATKKSNELMAYCYSHLYNMKITGLRFFTVYGPWGRPDMALSIFTKSILKNKPIHLFNYGNHTRDFTFIDDIVNGILNLANNKLVNRKKFREKYKVFNLGNNNPISLKNYVHLIEKYLGKKAKKRYKPLQQGDVIKTFSSTTKARKFFNYKSKTNPSEGVKKFITWYRSYYK